mgnify:CR=1 FL=1
MQKEENSRSAIRTWGRFSHGCYHDGKALSGNAVTRRDEDKESGESAEVETTQKVLVFPGRIVASGSHEMTASWWAL